MRHRSAIALAILILLAAVPVLRAEVFYSHAYDENSTNAVPSFYYSLDDGLHQCFADYYWDGTYALTDFHWWGMPRATSSNDDIAGFVFQIYDQAVGAALPGNKLYEQYVAGDANATVVDHNDNFGYDVCSYWLDLTTPFTLATTGNLWFSVYAVSNGNLDNWYWALGDDDPFEDDLFYAYLSSWEHIYDLDPNLTDGFAFELTGEQTIPEPTTLALLGLGLFGIALRRFRCR